MPELPELEVVKDVLHRRVVGRPIAQVDVHRPLVLRDLTGEGFAAGLAGRVIVSVARRGKFLVFELSGGRSLALNPMLSGRLQLCAPGERRLPKSQVTFVLGDGSSGEQSAPLELRYSDAKTMGKLYLTDDLARIPGWAEMGPDALDPELTLHLFRERLRRHPGEIKGILVNARFVAGIGNAYADEICFGAGIYPFRKRPKLSAEETTRLYEAMHSTLMEAIEQVRQSMGEDIHLKPRDFLAVHGKGGMPCPRCGTVISEVAAHQRLTNFCRHCQPGSLLLRG
jgi:formamidopyrimidine-DNA glycosylase